MAKLDIALTKEQHDALDDSLKTYYVATQDGGYELDGVGSIQRALEAEKAKRTTKPELVAEIEELRKFKADQEAATSKAAEADLEKKGQYEALLAAKEKAWGERLEAVAKEKDSLLISTHRERLTNELIKRGALPDRAGYLVGELEGATELVTGENGFTLKKKGGIGDADEFDAMIEATKQKTPFFFAADNASGSGANGSGNGANGGQTPKTLMQAEVSKLSPAAKREFYLAGGEVPDQ